MRHLETHIVIHATAQRVWQDLMDFDNFEQWNPFVRHISGKAQIGEKLEVKLQLKEASFMLIRPKVVAVEPQAYFAWKGHMGIKGLFDGMHYFQISPLKEGGVKFTHGEKFSGLLVGFILAIIGMKNLRANFNRMNAAFKQKVERIPTKNS